MGQSRGSLLGLFEKNNKKSKTQIVDKVKTDGDRVVCVTVIIVIVGNHTCVCLFCDR